MKVRIWTADMQKASQGKHTLPFLRACEGQVIGETFEAFDAWLATAPEGQLEVWAGRWWMISAGDGVPFIKDAQGCHCAHPVFRSRTGLDTKDFPGFFAYEAWKKAKMSHDFWTGSAKTAASMLSDAERATGAEDEA